jgi:hypothetical protein
VRSGASGGGRGLGTNRRQPTAGALAVQRAVADAMSAGPRRGRSEEMAIVRQYGVMKSSKEGHRAGRRRRSSTRAAERKRLAT